MAGWNRRRVSLSPHPDRLSVRRLPQIRKTGGWWLKVIEGMNWEDGEKKGRREKREKSIESGVRTCRSCSKRPADWGSCSRFSIIPFLPFPFLRVVSVSSILSSSFSLLHRTSAWLQSSPPPPHHPLILSLSSYTWTIATCSAARHTLQASAKFSQHRETAKGKKSRHKI